MRFFSSNVKNRIDDKGRVSIPAAFRKVLDAETTPGVVLIPNVNGMPAIDGMGHSRLERMAAALEDESPIDPAIYALQVSVIGEARQVALDVNGRIVLPPDLRAQCGLTGEEAVFVGLGPTFQIWAPEAWDAHKPDFRKLALANFDRLKLKPAVGP